MSISNPDFSPLKKIGLTEPAMGVKFSYFRPEGIPMLDKDVNMSLCEIFRKSQRENAPSEELESKFIVDYVKVYQYKDLMK